jgi:hypothetical protein
LAFLSGTRIGQRTSTPINWGSQCLQTLLLTTLRVRPQTPYNIPDRSTLVECVALMWREDAKMPFTPWYETLSLACQCHGITHLSWQTYMQCVEKATWLSSRLVLERPSPRSDMLHSQVHESTYLATVPVHSWLQTSLGLFSYKSVTCKKQAMSAV